MTPEERRAGEALARFAVGAMVAGVRASWRDRNDLDPVRRESARGVLLAAAGLGLTIAAVMVVWLAIVWVVVF